MLRVIFLSLLLITAADDPCEQPTPQEMADKVGVKLPPSPWHVANIWWDFEMPTDDFTSLEMDVTIDRDVPEKYNLYVSPCGIAKINGLQFYGGLQTNINGWADKESRTRVHRGLGAIFSRWSADKKTKIGLEHVRVAADDCLMESAGYEGEFASVRRPYVWKKGKYTWSITKGDTIDHKDARATWFTCRVKEHATGTTTDIGSLLFEGEKFQFWNRHSAFVEVYSTSKIPRSNIPLVNITFGWPRLNDKPAAVKKASAYYPDPTKGSPGSPDCANVKAVGDACVVEVGPIFKRDEAQRRHPLLIEKQSP
ncbi:hypothetical protein [Anatilimnocola floriformis]|uniref:hypothetical protein n=1 Tax=Anatilimnocola floriformis TaxID=2948575 RepID=UPI0020C39092|nr:hypothetical protein [Anatilimnocola floriformis]